MHESVTEEDERLYSYVKRPERPADITEQEEKAFEIMTAAYFMGIRAQRKKFSNIQQLAAYLDQACALKYMKSWNQVQLNSGMIQADDLAIKEYKGPAAENNRVLS